MKRKESARKFGISFNEVITKSQSIQPQYIEDIQSFTSFDPKFDAQFGETLLQETREALDDFSGSSHMASINRLTERISRLLDESGKSYQKLMYFVHSAFGTSKAIENTFGRKQYEKARKSEKHMIPLLKQAVKAASLDQFKVSLESRGMNMELLEEMEQYAAQLVAADEEQEMLKKQQLLVTNARIELYNSIWEKLTKINTAAKIVFANDPVRLSIYQLYSSTPKTEEQQPEVEGTEV